MSKVHRSQVRNLNQKPQCGYMKHQWENIWQRSQRLYTCHIHVSKLDAKGSITIPDSAKAHYAYNHTPLDSAKAHYAYNHTPLSIPYAIPCTVGKMLMLMSVCSCFCATGHGLPRDPIDDAQHDCHSNHHLPLRPLPLQTWPLTLLAELPRLRCLPLSTTGWTSAPSKSTVVYDWLYFRAFDGYRCLRLAEHHCFIPWLIFT